MFYIVNISSITFSFISVDPNITRRGKHQPKSWLVAIVASISCVAVTIIVLVLIFIFRRRKSSTRKGKLINI